MSADQWVLAILAFGGLGVGVYYTVLFIKEKGK